MKNLHTYLLGILLVLFAINTAVAQHEKVSRARLDSLNRVLDSVKTRGLMYSNEIAQIHMSYTQCTTDEERKAKLEERIKINELLERNAKLIRKAEEEVAYEQALINQIEREAKLAQMQKVKQATNPRATRGELNGYEWVDLGLPSGTKWATRNVGATKTSERGWFFAFGETTTRKNYYEYTWKHYKHNGKNLDNIAGNATYDAATVNMGDGWQMPSMEQWKELRDNCIWEYTVQDGVLGSLLVSKINANFIFLPVTGYTLDDTGQLKNAKWNGAYWSCTEHHTAATPEGRACTYIFNYELETIGSSMKCSAHVVRGVCHAVGAVKEASDQSADNDKTTKKSEVRVIDALITTGEPANKATKSKEAIEETINALQELQAKFGR